MNIFAQSGACDQLVGERRHKILLEFARLPSKPRSIYGLSAEQREGIILAIERALADR